MSVTRSRSPSRNDARETPLREIPLRGWVSVFDDVRKINRLETLIEWDLCRLETLINTPLSAGRFDEATVIVLIEDDVGDEWFYGAVPLRPGLGPPCIFPETIEYTPNNMSL